jgi:glutamyl-tRNA synthetase
MPQFAHLPLLLKPVGDGKLSKRDGEALGFPVFPLAWKDESRGVDIPGFREQGYLPEALLNFLALLGWNPGTEQEIFSLEELIEAFSLDRIGKSGTRFDIQKANWFNHQYLQEKPVSWFKSEISSLLGRDLNDDELSLWVQLVRERCSFPQEIWSMIAGLLDMPKEIDHNLLKEKWNADATAGLKVFIASMESIDDWSATGIKSSFSQVVEASGFKSGKLFLPLRIAMTGKAAGPDLMLFMQLFGKADSIKRLQSSLNQIEQSI